jgi:mono/diheme cytochrome c family protein
MTTTLRSFIAAAAVFAFAVAPFSVSAQPPGAAIPEHVPHSTQRPGDPAAGYQALVSKGWVGCGVPALYYDLAMAVLPDSFIPKIDVLEGRPQGDEGLPYFVNRFDTKDGLDVIAPNCLLCHAGHLNGKLVVGLGNADGRYQVFGPEAARIAKWIRWGSWLYFWSPSRRAEMGKVGDRMGAVAPYIEVPIEGANPTHNLAWALVVHRDPNTLAWSDEMKFAEPPRVFPPADVPPWWRMAKKNAMFYAAGGQGDHTGFMSVNSTLCVDTVEDFETFYDYFDDIRAYLASIPPPAYPWQIDSARAAVGQGIFEDKCAGCHGKYGANPEYPDRLIPLEKIGTDPALAQYNVSTDDSANRWLNDSVFTRDGVYAPFLAYVAPPLDGIWATAPFLHNGSVPTLAALLDSKTRPAFWTRPIDEDTGAFDSTKYDTNAVGWIHTALDQGQESEPDAAKRRAIVDTKLLGFSNVGHTYGDNLSNDERESVIEYLKTL